MSATSPALATRPVRRRPVSRLLGHALAYALMIAGAVVTLLPFLWMVSTSLNELENVGSLPPQWIPDPVVLHNYGDVWDQLPFGNFLFNSTYITLLNVVGQLLVCSLSAYAFARLEFRGPRQTVLPLSGHHDDPRAGHPDPRLCADALAELD